MASIWDQLDHKRQTLSLEFSAVTDTDPELAVYYLQQKSWIVEDAVNLFYDDDVATPSPSQGPTCTSAPSLGATSSTGDRSPATPTGQRTDVNLSSTPSPGFRLITWNIDGLDAKNSVERTSAVCSILKDYTPDIIFLQEVIPPTFALICSKLDNYKPLPASNHAYFTVILLKKSTVTYLSSEVESFPESSMMRALQIAGCTCAGIELQLMCSHLESTKDGAKERVSQFSRSLYLMRKASPEKTVLFGGDTNLRDSEVTKFGLPDYIKDLWEVCGSPTDAKFTWDVGSNDNLDWPFSNRPKIRFDRLFVRHAKPNPRAAPQNFALIGKDRVKSCGRFPSDHWGIVCDFQVIT